MGLHFNVLLVNYPDHKHMVPNHISIHTDGYEHTRMVQIHILICSKYSYGPEPIPHHVVNVNQQFV